MEMKPVTLFYSTKFIIIIRDTQAIKKNEIHIFLFTTGHQYKHRQL